MALKQNKHPHTNLLFCVGIRRINEALKLFGFSFPHLLLSYNTNMYYRIWHIHKYTELCEIVTDLKNYRDLYKYLDLDMCKNN